MLEKVFRFMRLKKLRQPKKLVNAIVSPSIYPYLQIVETFSNSNDHTKVRGRGNGKNYRSSKHVQTWTQTVRPAPVIVLLGASVLPASYLNTYPTVSSRG